MDIYIDIRFSLVSHILCKGFHMKLFGMSFMNVLNESSEIVQKVFVGPCTKSFSLQC